MDVTFSNNCLIFKMRKDRYCHREDVCYVREWGGARNIPDLLSCSGRDRLAPADLLRDVEFRRASFYVISVPILTRCVPSPPLRFALGFVY